MAISQTLGSLGDAIGREVGRTLSWEFADREIIAKAAERFAEGVMELAHVTEERPTLWERITDTKRRYVTYVEAIILEMAAHDNVILSGRATTILLSPVRHVLRVRITAPWEARARRVEQEQGLTHEAAIDLVRQTDRERAARVRFLYHVDWDDPLLYDLVLNTERLSVPRATRLIVETLEEDRFQSTPGAQLEVTDLSLVAQVKAAFLANPLTRSLRLSATCRDGQISVGGMVDEDEQEKAVLEIAGKVPGVRGVTGELVVVRPGRRLVAPL
ncbi:MAG: cytidylate kinase family protein [Candidatus Rokubacteria bacterium]|nr:cytidylate kinase family protein [Candidatus Rokubacteria bacterium]